MLTQPQFKVLYSCKKIPGATQRAIVEDVDFSLGTVNAALKDLRQMELIDENNLITPAGLTALAPYRVTNAVIMAAGLSSRFAPISYEKPKGVLKVLGEVIIERQIRQLREAGIDDITVVVGYKKEEFFYLGDEFGVRIIVNPDYASRNNNSTIKRVEHLLDNTYICSSDNYFTQNPFEEYVYDSYYSAVYEEGETPEYCLATKGKDDLITGVAVGGENAWVMLGHAYWSREFSKTFRRILDDIYDRADTAGKLWEDIYIDHIAELPMVMRKYRHGIIWEFDSLDELNDFDPNFIDNVDSEIMDNICKTMGCTRRDICGITPIKQGLTNLSFRFAIGEGLYVYRHPGAGTDSIISRKSETQSLTIARDLGLDTTFIYENPDEGWKISRYIEGCTVLDYQNKAQVRHAMEMARTLHNADVRTDFEFNVHNATLATIELLGAEQRTSFKDYGELLALTNTLYGLAEQVGARVCLCHNDFYFPNFLVRGDEMQLIDWEYSGMTDYASDLGVFICCCDSYSYEDVLEVLAEYFQRKPTQEELFHCLAYVSVVSFYWFIWALYKDACGDPVGEFLYLWYRNTKTYGAKAMELAREMGLA